MLVPEGVDRITSVHINVGADMGGASSVRINTQLRIQGQAVLGGPHDFSGPAGLSEAIGATAGRACQLNIKYDGLNIPVIGGNIIDLQGYMVGEDAGDLTMSVGIVYDS